MPGFFARSARLLHPVHPLARSIWLQIQSSWAQQQPLRIASLNINGNKVQPRSVVGVHKILTGSQHTAPFECSENKITCINSLLYAKTAEMLHLLLCKHVDASLFETRLHYFVETNNYAAVEMMLSYHHKININSHNLLFSDRTLTLLNKSNKPAPMLQLFLDFCEDYVPAQNRSSLSPDMLDILVKHNQKITKQNEKKKIRPKIYSVYFNETHNCVDTHLSATQQAVATDSKNASSPPHIVSSVKLAHSLSWHERYEMGKLFLSGSSLNLDFGLFRKLHSALFSETPKNEQSYVNLCKVKGEMVAFLYFDIKIKYHPSCGDYIIFHGKLTKTNLQYEAKGLANLAICVAYALQFIYPNLPIYFYGKLLRPGYSRLLIPDGVPYFPKYWHNRSLMNDIVSSCGDKLNEDNTVLASINIDKHAPLTWQIREHGRLAGPNPYAAVPGCYLIDSFATKAFIEKTKDNGVTQDYLEKLAASVAKLIEGHSMTADLGPAQKNNLY